MGFITRYLQSRIFHLKTIFMGNFFSTSPKCFWKISLPYKKMAEARSIIREIKADNVF